MAALILSSGVCVGVVTAATISYATLDFLLRRVVIETIHCSKRKRNSAAEHGYWGCLGKLVIASTYRHHHLHEYRMSASNVLAGVEWADRQQ